METDEKFLKSAKHLLDAAEQNLDTRMVARLHNARRAAIEHLRKPRRVRPDWLLPVGGLATAGIALAVISLLWLSAPNGSFVQAGISDIDLLTARESPEFFNELEFFEWLEGNENIG